MAVAPALVVEEVGPDASAAAVVRAGIGAAAGRVLANLPVVRAGEDPEGTHQARVGLRRLRSDLRTFRPVLDADWSRDLRTELRWLADAFGAVRDLDVLAARLAGPIAALGDDAPAAAAMIERLAAERAAAHERAVAALDSRRAEVLVERMVDAATAPRTTRAAAVPAVEVVPRLARKPFRRLRRAVHDIGEDPSAAELHQVRIRAKRARYAAEIAIPVVGRPAKATAKRLRALQGVLGDHQDCVVAEAWLRPTVDAASPREAFAVGLLVADQRRLAAELRRRWPDAWAPLERPERTAWMSG